MTGVDVDEQEGGGGAGVTDPAVAAGPWLRPERSGRGPVPEYSRDQITRAAISLADDAGLTAVSMRRVAQAVGTAPASLYRYVRTRDELLTLMSDAVVGEVALPERPTDDWIADLLALAHCQLDTIRRHPWLLDVGFGGDRLGPNSVDYLEYALACLAGLDHAAATKLEAVAMLTGIVTLFARDETAGDAGQSTAAAQRATVAFLAAAVGDGRHPHLSEALVAAGDTPPTDPCTRFDRVLTGVLHGLLGTASAPTPGGQQRGASVGGLRRAARGEARTTPELGAEEGDDA